MDAADKPSEHSLRVSVPEFKRGLRVVLGVLRRRSKSQACFSFDGDRLCVALEGGTAVAPATGTWPGQVRAEGVFLKVVDQTLRPMRQTFVDVSVDDGMLIVHDAATSCRIDPAAPVQVKLPLGATLLDKLALSARYDGEDIERAGLSAIVRDAHAERDRRILRAAEALEPLGAGREELKCLVESHVHERMQRNDPS